MAQTKLTIQEFKSFSETYYKSKMYKEVRLGQAFLNTMLPDENNPDIFYESDNLNALLKIYRDYII